MWYGSSGQIPYGWWLCDGSIAPNGIRTPDLRDKFIIKAIEDGWTVTKRKNKYIFRKYHCNLKEYFDSNYLSLFLKKYS
jgi:hypothetical protein